MNTVKEYEEYLKNKKNVSKNTLESYMRDVNKFSNYMLEQNCSILSTDLKILQNYINFLKINKKSITTINRVVCSLRSFFQYLIISGYISKNPTYDIVLEKPQKKLPQILSNDDIISLLNSPNPNEAKGCRDKAMLQLLYATGIRVSEMMDLNIEDVNISEGTIRCCNNKSVRFIPMYTDAIANLSNYINIVRNQIVLENDSVALFLNMNGTRLTRQGFWKIIKQYAVSSGIKSDITPHVLRHSFATHLLENGAKLKDVQEMLGHVDINSTQIYVDLLKNKFQDSYNKYHPFANSVK